MARVVRLAPLALALCLVLAVPVVMAAGPDGVSDGARAISQEVAPPMMSMGTFLLLAGLVVGGLTAAAVAVHLVLKRRARAQRGRLSADEADALRVVRAFVRETDVVAR